MLTPLDLKKLTFYMLYSTLGIFQMMSLPKKTWNIYQTLFGKRYFLHYVLDPGILRNDILFEKKSELFLLFTKPDLKKRKLLHVGLDPGLFSNDILVEKKTWNVYQTGYENA